MDFQKLTLIVVVMAMLAGVASARPQATESNAPGSASLANQTNSAAPSQPDTASPANQTNPAPPEQQKQPSGEPKPGQGATPDQHPSPLPGNTPAPPQVNSPLTSTGTEATPAKPQAKRKKSAGRKTATGKPRRRIVKDGGADETEVQISEGMPNDLAAHQRASTNTLLSSTEDNLKRISNRQLTADQRGTVEQIRLYMQQSRDAIEKSDVDRAHTLALKAHLLSDSLMKQ